MPKTFRPWHPEQTTLLPPSPSDWLSRDHQVYFLLDLVDELDLSQVLIPAQAKDPRGEKGFDPRMPASPGELPPEAPTDPYVTLSRHTAPVIQLRHQHHASERKDPVAAEQSAPELDDCGGHAAAIGCVSGEARRSGAH